MARGLVGPGTGDRVRDSYADPSGHAGGHLGARGCDRSGDARAEATQIVDEGRRDAEVVKVRIEAETQAETGKMVERAKRELKGFVRVQLEPGETQTVEIAVPTDSLAYYDVSGSAWVVEALEHVVHAGTSSRDLPLSTTLAITSEGRAGGY